MSEVTVYLASDLHPSEHVVLQPDYESVVFDLAALREELATAKTRIDQLKSANTSWQNGQAELLKRLTAAEQRNADTIAKLELAASMMDDDERGNRFAEVCRLAIESLKPTESGASE